MLKVSKSTMERLHRRIANGQDIEAFYLTTLSGAQLEELCRHAEQSRNSTFLNQLYDHLVSLGLVAPTPKKTEAPKPMRAKKRSHIPLSIEERLAMEMSRWRALHPKPPPRIGRFLQGGAPGLVQQKNA